MREFDPPHLEGCWYDEFDGCRWIKVWEDVTKIPLFSFLAIKSPEPIFDVPFCHKDFVVLVGLGFPAEVHTVMEAYRHLAEWPASLRDAAHSLALKACCAALRGDIEAETARGLFAALEGLVS